MSIHSVFWAITISLFVGALGFPIPENPILMGGGYAIFQQISPPAASLGIWYVAIVSGDTVLFAIAYWFFNRPTLSAFLKRTVGARRLEHYQEVFASRGGWTLFLARFTFGLRAVAYIAAGAARYSWRRFLVVDSISVAVQVILFVGIGYLAGEKVQWTNETGERILILIGVFAFISLLATWMSAFITRKISNRNQLSGTLPASQKAGTIEFNHKAEHDRDQNSLKPE
jgi:membrane protein DedA with SNARE-associated domain